MKFIITGIPHKELESVMFDLVTGHDLRAFKIKAAKEGLLLEVNKRQWIKTWRDTGCQVLETIKSLEASFTEELEGMGYEMATVKIIPYFFKKGRYSKDCFCETECDFEYLGNNEDHGGYPARCKIHDVILPLGIDPCDIKGCCQVYLKKCKEDCMTHEEKQAAEKSKLNIFKALPHSLPKAAKTEMDKFISDEDKLFLERLPFLKMVK